MDCICAQSDYNLARADAKQKRGLQVPRIRECRRRPSGTAEGRPFALFLCASCLVQAFVKRHAAVEMRKIGDLLLVIPMLVALGYLLYTAEGDGALFRRSTPTPTTTAEPSPSSTVTPSSTPSATPTPTSTPTRTATPTGTETQTPSLTPTLVPPESETPESPSTPAATLLGAVEGESECYRMMDV